MSNYQVSCSCTGENFSPDCPLAFFQDGKMMHVLQGNTGLQTRKVESGKVIQENLDSVRMLPKHFEEEANASVQPLFQTGKDDLHKVPPSRIEAYKMFEDDSSISSDVSNNSIVERGERSYPKLFTGKSQEDILFPNPRMQTFENEKRMMQKNRVDLRRFEALQVGGNSLTSMSIGGFAVDLAQAATQAREIIPLPPSKLPIIFIDDELNFHHHFFQGMEIMIGADTLNEVMDTKHYFRTGDALLFPLIETMLSVGYEVTDNELTLFTKKVLTTTFKVNEIAERSPDNKRLLVAANLFGFQYIEQGMEMKEADLKMWLSISYNHYRTIWFNTFKSSGVPSFALEGVQSRYEGPKKSKSSESKYSRTDYNRELIEATENIKRMHQDEERRRNSRTDKSRKSRDKPSKNATENVLAALMQYKRA